MRCLREQKNPKRDKNGRFISKKKGIDTLIDDIKVEKISEIYKITDGKWTIFAEKEKGGITLLTNGDETSFNFISSKPEKIKAIGELITKASEL